LPRGIWRNRDFRLVLGGGFVNNVGDWLLIVALPAFIYTETGSGRATAAVIVISMLIGIVFGPTGGSLADRWDLRRTVIATNVLQAVALLPLLAVNEDRLWPAFVAAAIEAVLQQINDPASFAMVPRIVPEEQLQQANAANGASQSLARLIGSPLGGLAAVAGGLDLVVVLDGVTFLAVAMATWFVRTPTASLARSDGGDDSDTGVREGWRQIRGHRPLVGYLGAQTIASVAFAMFPVLFIAFVVDVLSGDEATVGIIRGVAAFGGITASVVIGRFAKRVEPTRLMMWGYAGLGFVALVFVNVAAVTTALWIFFVLFALSGLPNITSQVGATTTAQRLCPAAVLGRLRGILSAAGAAGALAGSIGVGLLIDHVDVRVLLNAQALLYVACGAVTYATIVRPVASAPTRVGEPDDGPPTDRPAGEDATLHRR
jgi:Na+/melibiose symporter-like transporter